MIIIKITIHIIIIVIVIVIIVVVIVNILIIMVIILNYISLRPCSASRAVASGTAEAVGRAAACGMRSWAFYDYYYVYFQ